MVNRPATPPFGTPLTMPSRPSRTGPFAVMNDGMTLMAPSRVATAICGLGRGSILLLSPGLLPRIPGSLWHIAQLFPLKVGPSPIPSSPGSVPETESISSNRRIACSQATFSAGVSPGAGVVSELVERQATPACACCPELSGSNGGAPPGAPAPDGPPRGPGSTAVGRATPTQLVPVPVKLTVRLPVMPFKFTTLGLNVQPPFVGMTDTDAVVPDVLIGNEKVPVSPVITVACCCPASTTVTPDSGRPRESVITPDTVADSALVTESVNCGGMAPPSLQAAVIAANKNESEQTPPTVRPRLLACMKDLLAG